MFLGQQVSHDLALVQRGGAGWYLIGGILVFLLGALAAQNQRFALAFEDRLRKLAGWLHVQSWQVPLLVLSLPFSALVALAAGVNATMISPWAAVAAWLVSIIIVIVGGYNGEFKFQRPKNSTLAWAGGLFLMAFLLRGIATTKYPIFLTGDEGSAGLNAARFITGESNNIFNVGWFSFPTLFFFIQSLSMRVLGQTIEALRLPSAFAGALTVLAVYLVGHKMFSQRAGIFAALSLAVLHLHIHFSRIGLNNVWDGLWYVVVVGSIWVGWQHEDRRAYLLAGFGLGISQYFYPSSRTLIAVLLAAGVLAFIFNRSHLKRAIPDIVIMSLTAIVIFIPLGLFYVKHPDEFMAPLNRVSIIGDWLDKQVASTGVPAWRIVADQIVIAFQGYTYTPLLSLYMPDQPVLLSLDAAFFYVGLVLIVIRYHDSRMVLLGLWLTAISMIGGLSESTPAAQRYVAAVPACAMLVGMGLDGIAETLSGLWGKGAFIFKALALGLLAVMMTSNLYLYFVKYTQKSVVDNTFSNSQIAQKLADILAETPESTQVIFFGTPNMGYRSIPSIQYLVPDVEGTDINEPWISAFKPVFHSDKLVFVFLNDRKEQIPAVQADFPTGNLEPVFAWNKEVMFWVYAVEAQNGLKNSSPN